MAADYVTFMRDLEERYRQSTGLVDRSQYKIFYGPVRSAQVLVLGINPGGDPATVLPDGMGFREVPPEPGKRPRVPKPHAASAGFYENGESDLLDCDWTENSGLKKLLGPVLGGDNAIRQQVVKTNMAFRRSAKVKKSAIEMDKKEAIPFLVEIIAVVCPTLILLTGASLQEFTDRFCSGSTRIATQVKERDDSVGQVVFKAATVLLGKTARKAIAIQVAHASQFSWTYERYGIANEVQSLISTKRSSAR